MSDPIAIAAKMLLSELDAYERNVSPIEHGASLERAIVNLQGAVEAYEAIENWMSADRGGRL